MSRRAGSSLLLAAALTAGACSSSASRAAPPPTHAPSTTARPNPTTTTATTTTTTLRRSTGCGRPTSLQPGITDRTIRSGGRTRIYQLDIPKGYDGSSPYALVFGLHALTVNFHFVSLMSGFAQGERLRFIGVSPSGLVARGTPFWDAAPTPHNYDVTFLATLVDHLEAQLCIDPARVFSLGMSNGAQMSSLLACDLSTRIAGIGAVSGVEFPEPCPGRPVPIMAFHGTADPILPYTGGGLNATTIAGTYYYSGHPPPGLPPPLGVDESMRRWAAHNRCAPDPVEKKVSAHVTMRAWNHCAAPTVLYVIRGAGHQWPGQPNHAADIQFGPGTTEIDATKLMFNFFFS
jgi:polyhydroxybutyrate depolymerase